MPRQAGNHGIIIPRDREFLWNLYWVKELGLPQIGKLLDVSHKSVERVMRELNIPRRGKGKARYTRCVEKGCDRPIFKIRHAVNGSLYGKRCKEHWKKHRAKLSANYVKLPRVNRRRREEHARWYYVGPQNIDSDFREIQHGRRMLRGVKRVLIKPSDTPQAVLAEKLNTILSTQPRERRGRKEKPAHA